MHKTHIFDQKNNATYLPYIFSDRYRKQTFSFFRPDTRPHLGQSTQAGMATFNKNEQNCLILRTHKKGRQQTTLSLTNKVEYFWKVSFTHGRVKTSLLCNTSQEQPGFVRGIRYSMILTKGLLFLKLVCVCVCVWVCIGVRLCVCMSL